MNDNFDTSTSVCILKNKYELKQALVLHVVKATDKNKSYFECIKDIVGDASKHSFLSCSIWNNKTDNIQFDDSVIDRNVLIDTYKTLDIIDTTKTYIFSKSILDHKRYSSEVTLYIYTPNTPSADTLTEEAINYLGGHL